MRTVQAEGFVFHQRAPDPALAGAVTGLTVYDERGAGPVAQTETASLTVPLIFSYGAPFEIGLGRAPGAQDAQPSFAAGLFAGPVHIRSDGTARCIQISLSPLGAQAVLGLPMSALTDRMVALSDLSDPGLLELEARLSETGGAAAAFDLAEAFVLGRLEDAAICPRVRFACRALQATGGRARIGALAERTGWTRRHLGARVREATGLPPKTLARIIRFQRAAAMAGASEAGWAEIAAACGYADQAHLVREFAALAGQPPARWLSTHAPLPISSRPGTA